jgi:maltose alpha-D-glucosyltransferase/alpha-amylase
VQPVELDLSAFKGMTPVEMLGMTDFPPIGELPYFLTLPGYAFYWFRLQVAPAPITARVAPEPTQTMAEAPALFMGVAWDTLLDGNVRTLIERDLLQPFLVRQRWFGSKARPMRSARFVDWGLLQRGAQPLFLTIVEVEFRDGSREQYFLPLAICASADARSVEERTPNAILARITGARKGLLFDAWLDDHFARTLLHAIESGEQTATMRGAVKPVQTTAFAAMRGHETLRVSRMSAEQSNTSIVYGDRLILKLFRRIQPGINPDYEIGKHLTERVGFPRVPAVAAAFEYTQTAERPTTMAMMQQLVESQGDGWRHATEDLARYYENVEARPLPSVKMPRTYTEMIETETPPQVDEVVGGYLDVAETLGRRTAEMHLALAQDASVEAFAPEPFSKEDLADVAAGAAGQALKALDALANAQIPDALQATVKRLMDSRETLLERFKNGPALEYAISKIRVHGDYHLGQVLWCEGDFYILDFEGEPARPIEARRAKQSPLKDVAGMVRSFDYAAYAALFGQTAAGGADVTRLEPWARLWQVWVTAAFLRGYFKTAHGALFVPAEPSQRDELLELFVLDKALYELNYELNNRPDWIRIPLHGVAEILGHK